MADVRNRNITFFNNNTFRLTLDMSPFATTYDLPNCKFRLTIRPNLPTSGVNRSVTTLAFSSDPNAPTAGRATFYAQAKQLQLVAAEASVATIPPTRTGAAPVSYSYDAEIEDAQGNVATFLYGGATVNQGVT